MNDELIRGFKFSESIIIDQIAVCNKYLKNSINIDNNI